MRVVSLNFDENPFHVRSGIRTHAYISRLRPERSALDHSAILTKKECVIGCGHIFRNMYNVFTRLHVLHVSWVAKHV